MFADKCDRSIQGIASALNAETAKRVPVFHDARKTSRVSFSFAIVRSLIARFARALVAQ
jgi:hypothetical protein